MRWIMTLCNGLALMLLTACASTSWEPLPGSDEALMREYGAIVREAYRTGADAPTFTPEFITLEADLEERGLIDREKLDEVRKGVVYLGLPVAQLLASIDSIDEIDRTVINGAEIRTFRGGYYEVTSITTFSERFITCDGRLVAFRVVSDMHGWFQRPVMKVRGLNHSHSTASRTGAAYRTNFPPGYWDVKNRLLRKGEVSPINLSATEHVNSRWSRFVSIAPGLRKDQIISAWYSGSVGTHQDDLREYVDAGNPLCGS